MINCLLLLAVALPLINAANILVLAPSPYVANWLFIEEFIKDLLTRGHRVTAIGTFNARRKHDNYSDILVPTIPLGSYCKGTEITIPSII